MVTWKTLRAYAVFLLAAVMIFLGCGEAPRDNPLDPLSPEYENRGDLLVRAQSFYAPRVPLAGVSLFLSPGNILLSTNAEGTALFSNLTPQQYLIIASKDGYVADSARIEVQARQIAQHAFQLNAVPQIASLAVYSEHISRWFPINRDLNRLVVVARVQDADGAQDIAAVKLLSATHGELGDLAFRSQTGRFELALEENDLPGRSLFDFIGEPLQIEVHDRLAARTLSQPAALVRIVEATLVADTPSGFTRTDIRPRFAWKGQEVPYQHTFRVDISLFEPQQQFATLYESVAGIPSDSSTYLTNRDLPNGLYYWTVSIVDQYGNLGRSKEATFEVE